MFTRILKARASSRSNGHLGFRSIAHNLATLHILAVFFTFSVCSVLLYLKVLDNLKQKSLKALNEEVISVRTMLQAPNGLELIASEMQAQLYEPDSMRPYIRLRDREGRVVLESPQMAAYLPSQLFPPPGPRGEIRKWRLPGGELYLLRSVALNGQTYRGLTNLVEIGVDVSDDEKLALSMRNYLILFTLGSILFAMLSALIIVREGLKPLSRISATVRQITENRLGTRIDPDTLPVEMVSLGESFNSMLERLELSFSQLSQYSDNLAHELRTPINNLMLEADVALSRAREPEEYRRVIASSLEEYARLASIIDKLLFLARADHDRPELRTERLELRPILEDILDFYGEVAGEAGVSLRLRGGGEARVDQTLFRRAVSNLVSNAIRHTGRGGEVVVSVGPKGEGLIELSVRDSGCGIAAEDLPRVFDRFYQVERSRGGGEPGCGLGLSIVKAIMTMHGGTVSLESRLGEGTRVALNFPDRPGP